MAPRGRLHAMLRAVRTGLLWLVLGAYSAVLIVAGYLQRADEPTCTAGLVSDQGRCCAPGQRVTTVANTRRCEGEPSSCPVGFRKAPGGCELEPARVPFAAATLSLAVADWERSAAGVEHVQLAAFSMDRGEVTVGRYRRCQEQRVCAPTPPLRGLEPGLPVTDVTAAQAEAFCRWDGAGRLPTRAERRWAAAGVNGRRYPWGDTGLVCRRLVFDRPLDGAGVCPGAGLELAGSKPLGATPEGMLDLSGNAAELVRDPDGSVHVMGGSFRARAAAELKSWGEERMEPPAPHVGFRCLWPASSDRKLQPSAPLGARLP